MRYYASVQLKWLQNFMGVLSMHYQKNKPFEYFIRMPCSQNCVLSVQNSHDAVFKFLFKKVEKFEIWDSLRWSQSSRQSYQRVKKTLKTIFQNFKIEMNLRVN